MTHEMLRSEAAEHGYDVDGATVLAEAASNDDDVIDVWDQLPDADDFNPKETP